MGNAFILARLLQRAFPDLPPRRIVELGAGNGTFLLQLAKRFLPTWRDLDVLLVDRQRLLEDSTQGCFQSLSWRVEFLEADVFDWLSSSDQSRPDCIITNLFLHHFPRDPLVRLLSAAAERTVCFVACEPRRSSMALASAHLLALVGCNDITRHDAVVSVRAGFVDAELSALWPSLPGWILCEQSAGWFSHSFLARQEARQSATGGAA